MKSHIVCRSIAQIGVMMFACGAFAQTAPPIDWDKVNSEALDYFRTYLRFDTTNPPSDHKPSSKITDKTRRIDGVPPGRPVGLTFFADDFQDVLANTSAPPSEGSSRRSI